MKKNYTLLTLLFISFAAFSQHKYSGELKNRGLLPLSEMQAASKHKALQNKKVGDTLYYEPFNSLASWQVTNANSGTNNFEWEWSLTSGVSGIPPIASTTHSTGFLSLPSSAYNVSSPSGIAMDTYISSPAIVIDSPRTSVFLEYQQFLLYCCSRTNDHLMEVSTDSVNWTSFDASEGLGPNVLSSPSNTDSPIYSINISQVASMEDTLYLRIRSKGDISYSWMIDDITLLEGPVHDLILENPQVEFNLDHYELRPSYQMVPSFLLSPLGFSGSLINNGIDTTANAGLEVIVENTEGPLGGAGVGRLDSSFSLATNTGRMIPYTNGLRVASDTPNFVSVAKGKLEFALSGLMDSVDQNLGNESALLSLFVGDSIMARDDGDFDTLNGIGTHSFVDGNGIFGGTNFDAMGSLFVLESKDSLDIIPTSITFYVSGDANNIGVEILPTIWSFDETKATVALGWDHLNSVVADGALYTVTTTDLNGFLTLPISLTSGKTSLDPGQYIVGWESISGGKPGGTKYFEVGNDLNSANRRRSPTTFMYLEHDQVSPYGLTYEEPVVRLHFADQLISLPSAEHAGTSLFEVSPNPSNGQLKLSIAVDGQKSYDLNIRNAVGQSVYREQLMVNGTQTQLLDLSALPKGFYFVNLQSKEEKLVKKVILK